jgi:hypothetical protein
MKKAYFNFTSFIVLILLFNCNSEPKQEQVEKAKDERNIFSPYIKRGLTKTSEGLSPGYVMFNPTNSASVYLVNRAGEVVHEWKGNYALDNSTYLNDDGSIFVQATDVDFPVFTAGGEAGRLQKISWESKMLWDFEYANEDHHAHHDIAVMPNGNVLTIAWEARSKEAVIAAGRKPDLTPNAGLWTSKIVEIKPTGKTGGEEVWSWHLWDHLIQDFDPDKDNYGDVAAHPELIDFNVGHPLPEEISQDSLDTLHANRKVGRNRTLENRGSDAYHLNAVNYNEALDQIAFSSPELNEIFIIDRSTSREEAAGHTGGRYGKGGDLLYRWGNPQNYRQGDSLDQKLFYQHDIRWIEKDKPGAGNLTLYNNGIPNGPDSLEYSSVYELKPLINNLGEYQKMDNGRFAPADPHWAYLAKDTVSFYSPFISSAHRMRNGNTFINEGARGRFFEVTPDGDPKSPMPYTFIQFRATFIPADHPGLAGRDLKPLDPQPEPFELPPKEEKKSK